jgi:3-oxoacyl-[acyl-carrier protein] reductase
VGALEGRTALVTGGATGIGKAIALALADVGARVMVNHNHTPEPADAVVAQITESGGSALAIAADVGDRAEYQAMVDRLLLEYGRWDILVNNAAYAVTKPFPQITEAEFDLSYRVNVKGVFHGLQLAWDHLGDGGRIITISSSTTGLMLPGYAVYDSTKGAVEQFTHILSKEFGPRGITVNAVSPGATETRDLPDRQERAVPGLAGGTERLRPPSAAPRRSPPWSPSLPATPRPGSPPRTSESTAARSDHPKARQFQKQ